MRRYTAFGLTIEADMDLPELTAAPRDVSTDVTISGTSLPLPPGDTSFDDRFIEYSKDSTYFFWPDVGAFMVSDGRHIQYDRLPECGEDTLRLPLLGICIGTLLHQRRILTLHASAVEIEGRAVAFIGWKGTGKSTTAAALLTRGHTLLTDDVLALDLAQSVARVRPAFPQLKLAPSAIEALGDDLPEIPADLPPHTKRLVRTAPASATESVPLQRIYAIVDGESFACEPLTHREAFLTVLSQTYAARFVGTEGTRGWHFEALSRLLQRVPVYVLRRPRRLDQLGALASHIETHVLETA